MHKFWQEHIQDLEEFPCDLCDSLEFRKLSLPEKHGIDSQLVQCTNCGLLFLNPRWNIETYRKLYQYTYRTEVQKENCEIELEKHLPSSSRLLRIANGFNGGKKWQKVLDIGCGYGALLWIAKNLYGTEVFGFEPDTELAKSCNTFFNGNVLQATVEEGIEELSSKNEKFDLIVCQQSLNHFFHPVKILRSLRNILNYDGLLCLEVLNFSEYTRLKGQRIQVDHTHYFTLNTLSSALKAAGFMILFSESDDKTRKQTNLPYFLPSRHIRMVSCLRPSSFKRCPKELSGGKEIISINSLLKETKIPPFCALTSKIKQRIKRILNRM